ncbi:MAG: hypothetical protein WKF73_18075 [Nocardioidaceae bacterium]
MLVTLGPVPSQDEDITSRLEWERRAGWAAAWRELAGHTDEDDPLGRAPARGLVEKSALFRKAHEELRLLDVGAEEADMSDGRLRTRVRAMQLEEERAPAEVSDDLAAAHEQADKARVDATVWAARADAATGPDREQLRTAADQATRTAAELTDRITGLEAADEARGHWYLDTAVTRDYAHRSASELRARGIDPYDTSTTSPATTGSTPTAPPRPTTTSTARSTQTTSPTDATRLAPMLRRPGGACRSGRWTRPPRWSRGRRRLSE